MAVTVVDKDSRRKLLLILWSLWKETLPEHPGWTRPYLHLLLPAFKQVGEEDSQCSGISYLLLLLMGR